VAVYTGHDSKVMMNSTKSRSKFSKIELSLNKYILKGIVIQFIVCLLAALYSALWDRFVVTADYNPYYLSLGRYYQWDDET